MEENEKKNVEEKSVVEDFGQNQEQKSEASDDNVQKENKYKGIALNYFEKSMSSIKKTMKKLDEKYQIRKKYPSLFHKKLLFTAKSKSNSSALK